MKLAQFLENLQIFSGINCCEVWWDIVRVLILYLLLVDQFLMIGLMNKPKISSQFLSHLLTDFMIICVQTNRLTILQRFLIIVHEHNTILIASLRFKQFHNIVNMYGLVNNLNKSNYAHNIIMLLVFTHIADHTTTVAGIILVFVVSFDPASCCYGYCSLYFPALLLLLLLLVSVGLVVVGIELCYPLDLLLV